MIIVWLHLYFWILCFPEQRKLGQSCLQIFSWIAAFLYKVASRTVCPAWTVTMNGCFLIWTRFIIYLPNSLMSSRESGIFKSAVSGRKRPGTAPTTQRKAMMRKGAFSDMTDWSNYITFRIVDSWGLIKDHHEHFWSFKPLPSKQYMVRPSERAWTSYWLTLSPDLSGRLASLPPCTGSPRSWRRWRKIFPREIRWPGVFWSLKRGL